MMVMLHVIFFHASLESLNESIYSVFHASLESFDVDLLERTFPIIPLVIFFDFPTVQKTQKVALVSIGYGHHNHKVV